MSKVNYQSTVHKRRGGQGLSTDSAVSRGKRFQNKYPLGSGNGTEGIGAAKRRRKIDEMTR